MLTTTNDSILVNYSTFVVTTEANRAHLDASPFGVDVRWFIDPTVTKSAGFLELLQRLDALTFGPKGMPMDKWVFYGCAELPGFIYGFAMTVDDMTEREVELFGIPSGYDGPVPISMYIAIPMLDDGCWFGHNLASLNRTLPDRNLGFLATITKALGLKACQVEQCYGATQWASKATNVHTRFGPLNVLTAYTPAHSFAATLTYSFPVTDVCLRAAMGDPEAHLARPEASFHLSAENTKGMLEIQEAIENGAKYQVAGRASWVGDQAVHPITRL